MKKFLLKYKRTILFWIVFSAIVLYFTPRQYDYYLDDDIKNFKRTYFTPFLIWIGLLVSIVVFILVITKTKSIGKAGISFLYVGFTLACFLFIFQNTFLGTTLFLNRLVKKEILQRTYVINYLAGTAQIKQNFFPYDLSAKQISTDSKLINKLYNSGGKQNDTITLQFGKGIFGIAFQPRPFVNK